MRILFRYIFLELLVPFVLALMVLTFILLLTRLLNIAELFFERDIPIGIFFSIIQSVSLYLIGFTMPLAFLIGILICFGRLSRDNEILALRASGVHLLWIEAPVLILGLALGAVALILHTAVLPRANWQSTLQIHQLAQSGPLTFLEEKVWMDGFAGSSVYIQSLADDRQFRGIAIHQPIEGESLPRVIQARGGTFTFDPEQEVLFFNLEHGTIEEPRTQSSKQFVPISFGEYLIALPVTHKGIRDPYKHVHHLTSFELDERLAETPAQQIDFRALLQEKYSRTSMSFASIVFLLMGFPLSIQLQRAETSANLLVATILALSWYLLMLLGKALSLSGQLPVLPATWLANGLMGGLGLYLTARMLKE